MLEDKSMKKARAPESKKAKTRVDTHVGPSVTSKKFVTKIKHLKKRHVQTHDSNSNVDVECVAFIESGGWSEDKV